MGGGQAYRIPYEQFRYEANEELATIQTHDFYTIKRIQEAEPFNGGMRSVCRKKYRVNRAETGREIQFLKLLQRLNLQDIQTIRYIRDYMSKDGFLCFDFDSFDCVLSSVLGQGQVKFEEMALWHHFLTLCKTLFVLQGRNLYHRNLTSHSIFMREGELYIGNFDDAIELPDEVWEEQAYGPLNTDFPRPAHPEMYQYGWVVKEESWALGKVLLDMATLSTKEKKLQHLFPSRRRNMEQSQFKISKYVQSRLQGRYSHYLTEAILALLQVDHERRPSLQDFFHFILPRFYHETTCLQCGVPVRKVWPCPHILCDKCHFMFMKGSWEAYRVKHCSCEIVIDEALIRLLPEHSRFMAYGIMDLRQPCVNKSCSAMHLFTKMRKNGKLKPEYIMCSCRASYCPYCFICHNDESHIIAGKNMGCALFARSP